MSNTWKWVIGLTLGVALLVGAVFLWPGPQLWAFVQGKMSASPPVEATRDPLVIQQATALAAIQTQLAAETATQPAEVTPQPAENTPSVQVPSGASDVEEVYRSPDALAYPVLIPPDASREMVFPDVPKGDRPPLAKYEEPFEDGDFCDNTPCDMDIPQYYFRVMTAGEVTIPGMDVSCVATETKVCAVIGIDHFGPTTMYRDNIIDHGFTVAGRVFDMDTPEKVTMAAQALLDHYMYRMTAVEDGANCSVIDACPTVEWHVVVIGNGEVQVHWTGLFQR